MNEPAAHAASYASRQTGLLLARTLKVLICVYLASVVTFVCYFVVFAAFQTSSEWKFTELAKGFIGSLMLPVIIPLAGSTWFVSFLLFGVFRNSIPLLHHAYGFVIASLLCAVLSFFIPLQELWDIAIWHKHYEWPSSSDWRIYAMGLTIAAIAPLMLISFERLYKRKRILETA